MFITKELTDKLDNLNNSLYEAQNCSDNSADVRNAELCKEIHRIGDILILYSIFYAGVMSHIGRDPDVDDISNGTSIILEEFIYYVNKYFGGNL